MNAAEFRRRVKAVGRYVLMASLLSIVACGDSGEVSGPRSGEKFPDLTLTQLTGDQPASPDLWR
jgi:hypothetical protein